ncbi:MAG: hypothetical protein WBA51_13660 [Erythrobacter sp.]
MTQLLKRAGRISSLIIAMYASTGIAHANWTGTWDSQHGDLRLLQDGERVYGDYAGRGYFEGRVSQDGNRLRGTFQYNTRRNRNGYIEFVRNGDSFEGGWSWADDGPVSYTRGNWSGSLKTTSPPTLIYAVGRSEYWADFWNPKGGGAMNWAFEGVAPAQNASFAFEPQYETVADIWTGTFDTNYGELRLIQQGRRVFGEYAKRGYFEGCTHAGGAIMRGTFQYYSPRSKHGFIEFRTDGDGFEGTWTWTKSGVPASSAKINWRGARTNPAAREEVSTRANEMNFADMWSTITDGQRRWVLGSDYYDSCDPPEVDEPGGENEFPGEMLDPAGR